MTTTLVTGANGFIGRHVCAELERRGRSVVRFDRHRDAPGDDVFLGDVRDPTAVNEAMAHSDSWVHLAGVLGTQETISNPLPAAETNILGGLNVLQAAAQHLAPGVNIAVGNWWETNTYSISKTTVERFCEMFRLYRDTPVTVVRALNAYGPGQSVARPYGTSRVRKIIPSFMMRALRGHPIEVYGDGQQVMDMIYVTDVARILVDALEHTERHGGMPGVLEAGTGNPTTVQHIAERVIRAAGSLSEVRIVNLPMRAGETPGATVLADTSTLAPLGIKPDDLIQLDEGLADTAVYYENLL